MERREQRARRDRKKDARRVLSQKDEGRETATINVNQKSAPSDIKANDTKNAEVTAEKNPTKDKVVEDDPLRFANLKRETDEITALKTRKPQKRQVFSNWWRYEEPLPSENESQAVDFESLLHAPQAGNFKFKSEAQWDAGSFGQYGELFMPDAELLVAGLTSIPFYMRLDIEKSLLLEDEVLKMDSSAKANSVAYEQVKKSKQKPKQDVADLFRINYSDKYSVVDKESSAFRDTVPGTVESKSQFVVEQSPEPSVTMSSFIKPSARITPENVQAPVHSREGTPVRDHTLETAEQDFHFVKPSPPLSTAGSVHHSPLLSRESTPAKDSTNEMASQDFDFGRPPPPPNSHVLPRRDTVLAKETFSLSASQEHKFGNQSPSAGLCPTRPVEELRENLELTVNHATLAAFEIVAPFQNKVPSKEGITVQEALQDGQSCWENYIPQEATFSLKDIRNSPESVAPIKTTSSDKALSTQEACKIDSSNIDEHSVKQMNDVDSNLVLDQKPDGNDFVSLVSLPKKGGKTENRKHENNQKGGGRHGRKKKGQQLSTQEREEMEITNEQPESVQIEDRPEVTKDSTSSVINEKSSIEQETGSNKPCPTAEAKKKPERPPPPLQKQSPALPQASSNTLVSKHETSPVVTIAYEKQEVQQTEAVLTSSDRQAQPPVKKIPSITQQKPGGQADDDRLNFLMSLKCQKAGGISEIEAAKSLKNTAVTRSAIEEEELRESQRPKLPPVITTEKKEDLEDWLDSMLDD